jgi:hypothetical protein
VKRIPITVFAIIDDDTVHCDNKCELRSYMGNGYHWEHYCSVFDLALDYDRKCDKWIRCTNCIANEKAQKEEK